MKPPHSGSDVPGIRVDEPAPPPIPDHELIRCIGRGSYGEVWLARNVMGTYRAVKVVYRRTFQDDRPFEREYNGLQRFEPVSRSHESQVDILHIGRSDDWFYYVMELADDQVTGPKIDPANYRPLTLRAARDGQIQYTAEDTLEIGLALTMALEHLHQHGLVHRDVKPSNVIFVNGIPKLADIGLVSNVDATRSFVGTEGFVPPEGPGAPTGDLYSLGKVLYELCTGRDRKDYPELPTAIAESPDRERLIELNAIINKACRENPKDRYQNATAMRQDLLLMQSGKSVLRMQKLERRLRFVQRAGAAVTALAVLILAGWFYQARQTKMVSDLAEENLRLAEESQRNAEESQRNSKESNDSVVRLLVANGNRLVEEGKMADALPWLVEALERVEGDDEREEMHKVRLASLFRQMPMVVQLFRHDAGALWCEFSPDGRLIATASKDQTARIWDVATGGPVTPPLKHEDDVLSARFSVDGRRLVTASSDGTARVWDTSTGQAVTQPLVHRDAVAHASFGPHGDLLLTRPQTGPARVWNSETGQRIGPDLGTIARVNTASFSPDGSLVLTGDEAGIVTLWNTVTWRPLFEPVKLSGPVSSAAFSPDGKQFIASAWLANIAVTQSRSASNGQPVAPELRHQSPVRRSGFSPDVRRIVTTESGWIGSAGTRLWDLKTGSLLAEDGRAHSMGAAAYDPDGTVLAVCGEDGESQVLDAETLKPFLPPLRHGGWVHHNSFSPDGQMLATASEDGLVRIWDLTTVGDLERLLQDPFSNLMDAMFSPNGTQILGSYTDSGRVWLSLGTEPPAAPMSHTHASAQLVGASPDGSKLFLARGMGGTDWAKPSFVTVWNTGSNEQLFEVASDGQVFHAVFSPDGRYLLTSSHDQSARIWDSNDGTAAGPPLKHDHIVWHAAFSPDGVKVATASQDQRVQIWDWKSGRKILPPLLHTAGVDFVGFSPDGLRIVTGGQDQSVRIWDSTNGQPITPPIYHGGRVRGVSFHPDGRSFLSWGVTGYVNVWSLEDGARLLPPMHHQGRITAASFSPDGRFIISSSADQTARLWDSATGEAVAAPFHHNGIVLRAQFHPEMPVAMTASEDGAIRLWKYEPIDWATMDIRSLAVLLAPSEIDAVLSERPIPSEQVVGAFRNLRSNQPSIFATTPELREITRVNFAWQASLKGEWSAAIWQLNHLIKERPDHALLYRFRAEAFVFCKKWDSARRDYEKALELDSSTDLSLLLISTIRTGDQAASRIAASRYLDWLKKEDVAYMRDHAAYFLTCAADLIDDYALLAEWSLRSSDRYYNGVLQYRMGEYSNALRHFNAYNPSQSGIPDAVYYNAMTLWQLGRSDEAKDMLALANLKLEGYLQYRKAVRSTWTELEICELAREEAEALIEGGTDESADSILP